MHRRGGELGKIEQAGHHVLDLLLLCPAVADYGRFDGERRVLGDFEAGSGGGQHRDAADLPELEGGLRIECVEDVFDRDLVGLVFADELLEPGVNAAEAGWQWIARRKLYGAAGQVMEAARGCEFDYAEAGVFGAAVDAENAHGVSVAVVRRGNQSSVKHGTIHSKRWVP